MMKKNLKSILMSIVMLLVMCAGAAGFMKIDAYAASDKAYVYDYADILTADEEKQLQAKCEKAAKNSGCDIVIITTQIGHDYSTMDNYMAEFLDKEGYGSDAIIYGVDMTSRADRIYTRGIPQTDISQSRLDSIREACEDKFHDGRYYAGFKKYVNKIDMCLTNSFTTKLTYNMPVKLLIALVAAVSGVLVMMHNAKTHMTVSSTEYTKNHNFSVNDRRDIFINQTVTTRHIERSSSGGSSSGGGNHGSGGHF